MHAGASRGEPEPGIYANGGVYGGRAAALEVALRRLLSRAPLLRKINVALDYGGSFAVNLARRSLAPQHFALSEETGLMHSVIFQRPVCIGHANGAGWPDNTLSSSNCCGLAI